MSKLLQYLTSQYNPCGVVLFSHIPCHIPTHASMLHLTFTCFPQFDCSSLISLLLICHKISFPLTFAQITEILLQYVCIWYVPSSPAHCKILCVRWQCASSHFLYSHLFGWITNTTPPILLPILPQLIPALSLSPAIWPSCHHTSLSQFNMGSAQLPLPMTILASCSLLDINMECHHFLPTKSILWHAFSSWEAHCNHSNINWQICILMPKFLAYVWKREFFFDLAVFLTKVLSARYIQLYPLPGLSTYTHCWIYLLLNIPPWHLLHTDAKVLGIWLQKRILSWLGCLA